jgi:cell division GTPase FtsZ
MDENANNDLTVTVIATGLNSSVQSVSAQRNQRVQSLNERQPLPLSDAAQQLLENPPSAEKAKTKDSKNEDDFLDIPSFVRTQLD